MDLDSKLCYCFHISKRKIVNYVKRTRPQRASQVSECFGAGTGCGWCIPFLIKIHQEIVGDDIVEGDDITDAEYEALRARYREEVSEGSRARNALPGQPADDDGWEPGE
jgi:bacterioferritin-associated ferredoxin